MDLASAFVGPAASRPDSITGMKQNLQSSLQAMMAAAPPEIQAQLRLSSGFRSPEVQQQLWNQALQKYGSPEAARKWVAPPGQSQHGQGNAADMKFLSPAAQQWAHANAANFGLAFPLSNEPWHVEVAGTRGQKQPVQMAAAPAQAAPAAAPAPGGMGQLFAAPTSDIPVTPVAPAGATLAPMQYAQATPQNMNPQMPMEGMLALAGAGAAAALTQGQSQEALDERKRRLMAMLG